MKQKFQDLGFILSRDAQKKLIGGDHSTCKISINPSCGGGSSSYHCVGTDSQCQNTADSYCLNNDCCDNLDCTPIYA